MRKKKSSTRQTKTPEKDSEYSLEELELSVRSVAVIRSLDMRTLKDLVSKFEDDLRKSKHYSDKVLLQLKSKLANLGLNFGMREIR